MKLVILMISMFLFLITGFQTFGSEDKTASKNSRLKQTVKRGDATQSILMKMMKSLSRLEQTAKRGDATAQFKLGGMYYFGQGVLARL